MSKYIDADKLITNLERQNVDKKVIEPLIRIIDSLQQEQSEEYQRGHEQAEQNIVALIESRIAEILGDAQPAPILRAELRELIERIKEE